MTDNSKKYKVISLILLFYCSFVIFLGGYIPIEFVSPTFKNIYIVLIYISFPISLVWTIINVLKIKRPTVFITVATIISLLILLIVGFTNSMCGTTTEVIYKNKNNSQTIVQRSYGCGAWDSDSPIYSFYKVVPATPFFYIVTKFDTANIDKTVWINYVEDSRVDRTLEELVIKKAALEKAAKDKVASDKTNK